MNELERINHAANLGGIAYLIELTMRLYVHRTPSLCRFTRVSSSKLELEFLRHFSDVLTEVEKNRIKACRDFRNELLHSEWFLKFTPQLFQEKALFVQEILTLVRKLAGHCPIILDLKSFDIDISSLDFAEGVIFCKYRNVAVASVVYEIIVRKFAGEFQDLNEKAYSKDYRLKDVLKALTEKIKSTPETTLLLDNCRRIRNELLHCNFKATKKFAMKIAPTKVKLSGNVLVLQGNKNWNPKLVSDLNLNEGGVFGWALEGLASDAADVAFEVLSDVAKLIYLKKFVIDSKPDVANA